ncbi:MAG TPA: hypothetical protein VL172_13630, partial [Kofleriaceae bacterium]|nr:hypothetical protein [Kofleriaceae bacterium]
AALGLLIALQYRDLEERAAEAVAAEAQARDQRDAAEGLTDYMLSDLRAKLDPIGKLALMADVGRQVDGYYRQIGAQAGNLDALARRAMAMRLLSDVARAGGDSRGAAAWARESAELALMSGQAGLATASWANLGDVLLDQGDTRGAAAAFAVTAQVGAGRPGVSADLDVRAGQLARHRGDNEVALAAWRRAARAYERLPAGAGGDDNTLIATYIMTGGLLAQMGRNQEALVELGRCSALLDRLLHAEPDSPDWLHRRFVLGRELANTYAGMNDMARAETERRAGVERMAQLTARDPANAAWQADQAMALFDLGQTLMFAGHQDDARDTFERGIAIEQRLVDADPDQLQRRTELGSLLYWRTLSLGESGRTAAALVSARQWADLARGSLSRSPDDVDLRYQVAQALVLVGDYTLADSVSQLAAYREAADLVEGPAAQPSSQAMLRSVLSDAVLGMAKALRAQGKIADSHLHAVRALAMLQAQRDAGELEDNNLWILDEARSLAAATAPKKR